MIVDCISDLHGLEPKLPGGDLLILAGDYTASDTIKQWADFFRWLSIQPYSKKIMIGGNHDNFLQNSFPTNQRNADELKEAQSFLQEIGEMQLEHHEYLCDSGTEYNGLKIWGTPWSLWFQGIDPHSEAFTGSENDLCKKFDLIPEDIDILVAHSPPFGILDEISLHYDGSLFHAGSKTLKQSINKIIPKLVVFGHIHDNGGQNVWKDGIIYVNSSLIDYGILQRIRIDKDFQSMKRVKTVEKIFVYK